MSPTHSEIPPELRQLAQRGDRQRLRRRRRFLNQHHVANLPSCRPPGRSTSAGPQRPRLIFVCGKGPRPRAGHQRARTDAKPE